jgi:HK97 family phage major capsid protein
MTGNPLKEAGAKISQEVQMKLRMLIDEGDIKVGTQFEADEKTAKEYIDAKKAEEYTAEMEAKDNEEIKNKIKEGSKMTDIKKEEVKPTPGLEVKKEVLDGNEWKSMGEFLNAVKIAEERHIVDPRLVLRASSGMGEDSNGAGGYLVQHPLWNAEIFAAMMKTSVIAPKCRQFIAEDYANGLKFKQVAETARTVTSTWGGVRFYNVDEGSDITDSKPVFQQADCPIKQMGALYYLTQALIDDCPNIAQFVAGKVGQSYGWMIDNEILNGSLSIMTPVVGHGATVAVTVVGANPTAAEWLSIYNSVASGYQPRSEWYMSTKTYAGLLSLTTPILAAGGSVGIPLVQRDFTDPAKTLLLGRPVNVMEQCTAQSTAGNILYGDFSEYAIVTKGSMTPQVAMSLHVKFISNQQTYRFIARIGGLPLLYSKITLPDTSVVSNIATRN